MIELIVGFLVGAWAGIVGCAIWVLIVTNRLAVVIAPDAQALLDRAAPRAEAPGEPEGHVLRSADDDLDVVSRGRVAHQVSHPAGSPAAPVSPAANDPRYRRPCGWCAKIRKFSLRPLGRGDVSRAT